MKISKTSSKDLYRIITRVITAAVIIVLVLCLAVSCAEKKAEQEKKAEEEEQTIEYKANSPIGIAESYVGKDVKDLIEAVGTLKGEPVIEATNDGGGYQGTYEFEGFTVYTYAKSEDSEAVVIEVVPDVNSKVYKESLKTDNEGSEK